MTVSAGVGGGSVVGVVLGGGAVTGSGTAAPAEVVSTLPFTGAGQLMVMVAIAIVLLLAGALTVGLARRASDGALPEPT
jgi:hypothetical protein